MGRSKKHRDPKGLFAKRLHYLFEGRNFLDFERKYGLSNGQIGKFIDGAEPRRSALESIINGTGCNPVWLLTGIGEPFTSDSEKSNIESASKMDALPFPSGTKRIQPGFGGWPITKPCAANSLQGVEVDHLNDEYETIMPPPGLMLVPVNGDSMEPLLLHGQYAMIEKDREGFEGNGGIYVVEAIDANGERETYIKRCRKTKNMFSCISLKEGHDTFDVPAEQCRLWPVIGVWFAGKGRPPTER